MNLYYLLSLVNTAAFFIGRKQTGFTYKNSSPLPYISPPPPPQRPEFIFENLINGLLQKINYTDVQQSEMCLQNSGYLKTLIFDSPKNLVKKCRITKLYGDEKMQMLNIVIYPNNSAPIFTYDIVQFYPNTSVCFVNFYSVPENSTVFNQLKEKWEVGTLTVLNTHLLRFLASWVPKIGNVAAAAKRAPSATRKNVFLYFNIKNNKEMEYVYEATDDIMDKYMNYVLEDDFLPPPPPYSSTEFDSTRRNIEKKFIYTKFMKQKEIDDYMDFVFDNDRNP